MDVKDAVKAAKSYVAEIFAEEKIVEIGLEEVEFDDRKKEWKITIGFRRPWVKKEEPSEMAAAFQPRNYHDRWYKLVRIRDMNGEVVAVKDRELRVA
jgi:hypothetical protein